MLMRKPPKPKRSIQVKNWHEIWLTVPQQTFTLRHWQTPRSLHTPRPEQSAEGAHNRRPQPSPPQPASHVHWVASEDIDPGLVEDFEAQLERAIVSAEPFSTVNAELVDMYRTLAELAGIHAPIQSDVQGVSLASLFDDPAATGSALADLRTKPAFSVD